MTDRLEEMAREWLVDHYYEPEDWTNLNEELGRDLARVLALLRQVQRETREESHAEALAVALEELIEPRGFGGWSIISTSGSEALAAYRKDHPKP